MVKSAHTYIISYQNSPMEVTVVVKKSENARIISFSPTSCQYNMFATKSYFWESRNLTKHLRKRLLIQVMKMNRSEYFHQKLIAPGKRTEVEAASLMHRSSLCF